MCRGFASHCALRAVDFAVSRNAGAVHSIRVVIECAFYLCTSCPRMRTVCMHTYVHAYVAENVARVVSIGGLKILFPIFMGKVGLLLWDKADLSVAVVVVYVVSNILWVTNPILIFESYDANLYLTTPTAGAWTQTLTRHHQDNRRQRKRYGVPEKSIEEHCVSIVASLGERGWLGSGGKIRWVRRSGLGWKIELPCGLNTQSIFEVCLSMTLVVIRICYLTPNQHCCFLRARRRYSDCGTNFPRKKGSRLTGSSISTRSTSNGYTYSWWPCSMRTPVSTLTPQTLKSLMLAGECSR